MGQSEARVGIRMDTKSAEQGITSVRGMFAKLGQDAKGSILAGVGLGVGVSAFNALSGAVTGTVRAMGDMVQSAIDEEVGIRRLTTAIQENVAGWDGNIDAIEAVITARQRLGFADDEQRESLAVLTSVTKDAAEALELQRTAMDLARLRGMSLADASLLLGKVYSGNVGILSRYGIQLERGTTATEALAEIQNRAAGQAEAFADTTAGAAASLQIELENLGEEIGAELLPVIRDLAVFARDVVVPAIRGIFDALRDSGAAARTFSVDLHNATGGLLGMSEATATDKEQSEAFLDVLRDLPPAARGVAQFAADAGGSLEDFEGEVEDTVEVVRSLPGDIADALRQGRQDWRDAVDQLAEDWQMATDEMEIQALQAALAAGGNIAEGLKSSNPIIKDQAMKARNLIAEQLAFHGIFTEGHNVGSLWAKGITGGVLSQLDRFKAAIFQYSQLMIGKSPPPKGPLKDVDVGGFNTGMAWIGGMNKALASFSMPNLGLGASGGGLSPVAAAGGTTPFVVHSHVYLDGKQIAESVDRELYFMAPGSGRLPT